MATLEPTMIGGTQVLRNPNLDPLSDRQLKDFAPTIFAKSGRQDVSDKYGFVDSAKIINAMRDTGFDVVEVRQSKRRDSALMPWTKHMLKFRKTGVLKKVQRGDVVPQVVTLNSHDRSSGFQLYFGLFRCICNNGMLVSEGAAVEPIKIPHTLRMVENVVSQSQELIQGADGIFRLRDDMLATKLSPKQQIAFATAALEFRPPRRAGLVDPRTLLEVRRPEDDEGTLWHTFNRVQENMLRGGMATVTPDGRNVATRGIGRIERDVEVNSRLWSLAVQSIAKAAASSKKAVAAKKAAVTVDDEDDDPLR